MAENSRTFVEEPALANPAHPHVEVALANFAESGRLRFEKFVRTEDRAGRRIYPTPEVRITISEGGLEASFSGPKHVVEGWIEVLTRYAAELDAMRP